MNRKLEKKSKILKTILFCFALLFFILGFISVYQGEGAVSNFLLGACFLIIASGKKIWDKTNTND